MRLRFKKIAFSMKAMQCTAFRWQELSDSTICTGFLCEPLPWSFVCNLRWYHKILFQRSRTMRNIIVFDTANKPYHVNRIFNPEVAARFPGAMIWVRLHEEAKRHGFEMVTCDQVSVRGIRPSDTILVTEQWSPFTLSLIRHGALPGVIVCGETLWHAWSFYSNLRRIST